MMSFGCFARKEGRKTAEVEVISGGQNYRHVAANQNGGFSNLVCVNVSVRSRAANWLFLRATGAVSQEGGRFNTMFLIPSRVLLCLFISFIVHHRD